MHDMHRFTRAAYRLPLRVATGANFPDHAAFRRVAGKYSQFSFRRYPTPGSISQGQGYHSPGSPSASLPDRSVVLAAAAALFLLSVSPSGQEISGEKNLGFLIRSWARLQRRRPACRRWYWPGRRFDYRQRGTRWSRAGGKVLFGFIDDEDLPAVYSAAVFVFPSLVEGFGYPA